MIVEAKSRITAANNGTRHQTLRNMPRVFEVDRKTGSRIQGLQTDQTISVAKKSAVNCEGHSRIVIAFLPWALLLADTFWPVSAPLLRCPLSPPIRSFGAAGLRAGSRCRAFPQPIMASTISAGRSNFPDGRNSLWST